MGEIDTFRPFMGLRHTLQTSSLGTGAALGLSQNMMIIISLGLIERIISINRSEHITAPATSRPS